MSLFISFEGLDNSGKSTQVRRLEAYLQRQGRDVLVLREPGGTPVGEQIRTLLLDTSTLGLTDSAELFLFSASRAQLVHHVIRPALKRGVVVVCDRFVDSTTAYQGAGRGIAASTISAVNQAATAGLTPDVTYFLDVPVEVLARRGSASRSGQDRMESNGLAFYERVRSAFLAIAEAESRFHVIDGSLSEGEVGDEVLSILNQYLSNHSNA